MEQILKNSSTLTPAQRAEYREHLMPALRHEGGFLLKGGHGIYLEANLSAWSCIRFIENLLAEFGFEKDLFSFNIVAEEPSETDEDEE